MTDVNAESTRSGSSYFQENFNLPNVLTSLRILFIPLFAFFILRGDNEYLGWMWAAFGLFIALMITDKLDGDIARARNMITDFGKIADPIADKALMTTALVCLNLIGVLPVWVTVVIVIREFGITLWRMWMLRRGQVVPASKGGKLKTALQTLAIGLYLCPLPGWMDTPTWLFMLAAVLVTVGTGIQYLWDARTLGKLEKR
ncbi:MAG TPA: CDP-diacylglycerol--glycerol-3-phosphate 3-phosphatidyltransferase [Corynebacterium sp.]|nr:CDP-diacylglycerol--glycerol-3-phosphate 3-phosphatidyltransferase [Corynebacterium sp.]